jgi:hypothetical protein
MFCTAYYNTYNTQRIFGNLNLPALEDLTDLINVRTEVTGLYF